VVVIQSYRARGGYWYEAGHWGRLALTHAATMVNAVHVQSVSVQPDVLGVSLSDGAHLYL
jgi:hypothetical protein